MNTWVITGHIISKYYYYYYITNWLMNTWVIP